MNEQSPRTRRLDVKHIFSCRFLPFHQKSLFPCSNQRQQSLADGPQRRPLPSQRLQQRAELLLLVLAGQPAAAAGLRRPAAQQAQALPDDAAAVRQRHLARDRRARSHAGAGTGGECWRGQPGGSGEPVSQRWLKTEGVYLLEMLPVAPDNKERLSNVHS